MVGTDHGESAASRPARPWPVHRRPPLRRQAHLETFEGLQAAVPASSGSTPACDPLVVVLDLSSPIIEDRDIAAMLYGRTVTTMLDPSTPVTTTRDRARASARSGSPAAPPGERADPARDMARVGTSNGRTLASARNRIATPAGVMAGTDSRSR